MELMADTKAKLLNVKSCNLGKLAGDQVALKINFVMSVGDGKEGSEQSAVFGLTHELAGGLAKALIAVLEDMAKPTQN
jgi:hypothetical protein